MRKAFLMAVALVLGVAVTASAEVTSGPQVGDSVGAFTVTKVAGNADDGVEAGKSLCYRCKMGQRPVVMVFARTADPKLAQLLKKIEEEVAPVVVVAADKSKAKPKKTEKQNQK